MTGRGGDRTEPKVPCGHTRPPADRDARPASDPRGGWSVNRSLRVLSLFIASALALGACSSSATIAPSAGGAPAGSPPASAVTGVTITVTSLWGGSEQAAFQKVLDAFKAATGITATYQAQRTDYATVLQTKITSGSPPDVAIMPNLGFLRQFARSGGIKKISDLGIDPASLAANYPPGILDSGMVDGQLYGIMVKFNSKSTVWYLSLIHISEPTRLGMISYAVFCLK